MSTASLNNTGTVTNSGTGAGSALINGIIGTWAGGFGAWKFGPWAGLLFGVIAGSLLVTDGRALGWAKQRLARA